jgi:hypothetical protein
MFNLGLRATLEAYPAEPFNALLHQWQSISPSRESRFANVDLYREFKTATKLGGPGQPKRLNCILPGIHGQQEILTRTGD